MLSLHSKTALFAAIPLVVVVTYLIATAPLPGATISIGIEHEFPGALRISRSIGGNEQIIDITNDSPEMMLVSVPNTWRRDEVRGVSLDALDADTEEFGFRRWHMPGGASVTFRTFDDWQTVTLYNPSGVPLHVYVRSVNVQTESIDDDAYLMKDDPLTLTF